MKTYTLRTVADGKQEDFTDPKAAGAAWFQADTSMRPYIILSHESGSASFYAQTITTSKQGAQHLEKSLPVEDRSESVRAFRAGFFQAMLESQGIAEGAVYKAKPGQRYSGPVVINDGDHLIQQVAAKTFIAHQPAQYAGIAETGNNLAIQRGTILLNDRQVEQDVSR